MACVWGVVYGLFVLSIIGGGVLVPLGLPYIPGRSFSVKALWWAPCWPRRPWPPCMNSSPCRPRRYLPGRHRLQFVCGHELHGIHYVHLTIRRPERDETRFASAGGGTAGAVLLFVAQLVVHLTT